MTTILVIDPMKGARNILKERLEYEGFTIDVAESNIEGAEKCTQNRYDLIVSGDNSSTLRCSVQWIALAESHDIDTAIKAIRNGASDYITKPVNMNRLLESVRTLTDNSEPCGTAPEPALHQPHNLTHALEPIIGQSPIMTAVKALIDKVAPSEARVLITGANGTGKELAARWLHEKSNRRQAPFVEVNCAAIPSELIESELFGHEKGAFTSAIKQHKGKFEQAIGGTLFLDEIGDMSLSAQAKVLRALQERTICRVGSDRDIDVDVRVVAATNKNLREEIARGNFREDLYHRLSVVIINIPTLGERRSDIPELIAYFLDKICFEYKTTVKQIEPEAVEELVSRPWTGNVREIRNVIERLIILSNQQTITLNDILDYAPAAI